MGSLVVQVASRGIIHGYAGDGALFDSYAASAVCSVSGLRDVHLVTAGRPQNAWCLVMEPYDRVCPANAAKLQRLMQRVCRALGFESVRLLQPVERLKPGPARDVYDWLDC